MKNQAMLAAVLMAALWTACAPLEPAEDNRLRVLVTTGIIGDVVQNVAGEGMEIVVLLPPGTEAHGFSPTSRDLVAISESDLIFINGLGLEESLMGFLESTASAQIVSLSEDMKLQGSSDPHVWTNPKNVSRWIDRIANELIALDPLRAATYQINAAAYKAELESLDEWAASQLNQLEAHQRSFISDHEILTHFALRYDFEIVGTLIPGTSSLADPSAAALSELERAVEEYGRLALFVGSPESEELAAQFAADTGIHITAIFVESLSGLEGPAASYLEMMRYDVNVIVNALK